MWSSALTERSLPSPEPRRAWSATRLLVTTAMLAGCSAAAAPVQGPSAMEAAPPPQAAGVELLAPGITHRYEHRPEGPFAIHLVEIDPRACGVELRAAKGAEAIIGRETTTALFARESTAERPAVVAVNADFFRYQPDGVPEGPQVASGEVVAAAGTYGPSVSTRFGIEQPVFGVTRSGRPFVGEVRIAGQVWSAGGNVPLGRLNALPGPDSLALFNRFAGGTVAPGDSAPGTDAMRGVTLRMITGAAAAGDVERAVVVGALERVTGASVPADGRVLAGRGAAEEWLRTLSPGDTVAWHLAFAGAPGAVAELVGGFPLLVLDGESVLHRVPRIWPPFATGRHPRTAVGIRADGTVILVVVDGRQEGYSVGMTLEETAALMLELGAIDALNLDGGGSTTLVTGRGIVNRPSDAQERAVANALVVSTRTGCG
jgi:large repetitive protein